jgi:hypothetical protein
VRTELRGAPHGFDALRPEAPPARAFAAAQVAFLRDRLGQREGVEDRATA